MPKFNMYVCSCRADYQKISQKLKDRKQPPPIPGNVPLESRPSLVGALPEFRVRTETFVSPPIAPALPVGQSFDVSAEWLSVYPQRIVNAAKNAMGLTVYTLYMHCTATTKSTRRYIGCTEGNTISIQPRGGTTASRDHHKLLTHQAFAKVISIHFSRCFEASCVSREAFLVCL